MHLDYAVRKMWSTAAREAPSSQPLFELKDLSEAVYSDIVGDLLVGMGACWSAIDPIYP